MSSCAAPPCWCRARRAPRPRSVVAHRRGGRVASGVCVRVCAYVCGCKARLRQRRRPSRPAPRLAPGPQPRPACAAPGTRRTARATWWRPWPLPVLAGMRDPAHTTAPHTHHRRRRHRRHHRRRSCAVVVPPHGRTGARDRPRTTSGYPRERSVPSAYATALLRHSVPGPDPRQTRVT